MFTNSKGTGYDDSGRRLSLTLPNGVAVLYEYMDVGFRPSNVTFLRGGNLLGTLIYQYDAKGSVVRLGGSLSQTTMPTGVAAISYDSGNRVSQKDGLSFTYDHNGNLVSHGQWIYGWNVRDQLVSATGPGAVIGYQYDGFGRRVARSSNGFSTNAVFGGWQPLQRTSGGGTTTIVAGAGLDEVLAVTSGTTYYPMLDFLHTVIGLTDDSGSITTRYAYEAFGVASSSGASSENVLKFTGRDADESGIYYFRYRNYLPTLGQFISEDPRRLNDGKSAYGYGDQNPGSQTDPFGLESIRFPIETFPLTPGMRVPALQPTGPLAERIRCVYRCTGYQIPLNSTHEPVDVHPDGSPHARRDACDIPPDRRWDPAIPRCGRECGFNFVNDERITRNHWHLQIHGPNWSGTHRIPIRFPRPLEPGQVPFETPFGNPVSYPYQK